MRGKPERLARIEFCCPNCKQEFLLGAYTKPKVEDVHEAVREQLKVVTQTPIPRIDIEDGGELVAGNQNERYIVKAEQTSIDELWRKDLPKRQSALKNFR